VAREVHGARHEHEEQHRQKSEPLPAAPAAGVEDLFAWQEIQWGS
jgi:hypothetical protein